ncbi:conserved hypothetical protein [Pseudomonas sp. 8Z]|uniref:DUF6685 family protein n=1 Tax=Pseudomonas sp. 8Z TaxID=2653166 RepID=UPI0012F455B5|nr:DUF6685 family protein [Pseudomonas sp. 8Z]VXC68095.1 conserved hypothetical protein [Pseudomonas sp. 8Z]
MNLPESQTFSARLTSLAQRLGLIGRTARQIFLRASTLHLPFKPLPIPGNSIAWQDGPPLYRLVDLPRDALSGPVQEDKAQAHAALAGVVSIEQQMLPAFDLRLIDGFASPLISGTTYRTFEDYTTSEHCKQVRIISYKDFIRTFSLALPRYLAGERIELRQASWLASRTFWAGDQQGASFAGAVVYARRRGLEVVLPANLTHYHLNTQALKSLGQRYHVLAMPCEAWNDAAFMALLLDSGMPYARLSLWKSAGTPELLLLPKDHSQATALGEGLRQAGAPDMLAYMNDLNS